VCACHSTLHHVDNADERFHSFPYCFLFSFEFTEWHCIITTWNPCRSWLGIIYSRVQEAKKKKKNSFPNLRCTQLRTEATKNWKCSEFSNWNAIVKTEYVHILNTYTGMYYCSRFWSQKKSQFTNTYFAD